MSAGNLQKHLGNSCKAAAQLSTNTAADADVAAAGDDVVSDDAAVIADDDDGGGADGASTMLYACFL